jgi:polysaccharide pyruvyl transferase WcaK-like protein
MCNERPVRIALLSPQSNRNLGDTATFAAAVAAYRRRLPDVELVVVVPEPAETAHLFGTAGFPLYGDGAYVPVRSTDAAFHPAGTVAAGGRLASMRRVYAFLSGFDAIVFTGGGQLDDFWGGAWTLPFWILTWTAAARIRGVRVLFHAVGYDRLTSRASRVLALIALRLAHYRSFRDAESASMTQAIGLSGACDVIPDLAFALDWNAAEDNPESRPREPYVIINPVSERMWTHDRDRSYADYLDAFVALSRRLLERGLAVKLLSTQDRMDADALAYVADALAKEDRRNWQRVHCTRLDHFMALAGNARLVVSSRLHGLILSLVTGTPAVSVAPMRKMTRLMTDAGLADFNLDMAELQGDALAATVDRALDGEERLRRHVAQVAGEYRRHLNENFDRLASGGLLGERARRRFQPGGQLETRSVA